MPRNEDGTRTCKVHPRRRSDELVTEAGHAELLDVGAIARRVLDGELPAPQKAFRDCTRDARSLQEALDQVEAALDAFDELPAAVRLAADHDPVILAAMLEDPEQVERLTELGLPVDSPATVGDLPPSQPDPVPDPEPPAPENPAPQPDPN